MLTKLGKLVIENGESNSFSISRANDNGKNFRCSMSIVKERGLGLLHFTGLVSANELRQIADHLDMNMGSLDVLNVPPDSEQTPMADENREKVAVAAVCGAVGYGQDAFKKSHPHHKKFLELTDWFKPHVCDLLKIPKNSTWIKINKRVLGNDKMNTSQMLELYREMYSLIIEHPDAAKKFAELDEVRYNITGEV